MNDQPFRAFINLIEHDQAIRHIRSQIDQVSSIIRQLQEEQNQYNEEFEQYQAQVKNIRKQVDELEREMKELDEQEQNKKRQLDQIATNKEYQALKKEIAQLKFQQHAKEEVLLSHWNQLDAATKELKTKKTDYEQKIASIQGRWQEEHKVLQQLEHDVAQREQEREQKESLVPTEWLEKYRHMRSQTTDPVVPVISGSCGSCFSSIRQQDMIRLMNRALVQCKGCFRLMYMQEAWKER